MNTRETFHDHYTQPRCTGQARRGARLSQDWERDQPGQIDLARADGEL